MSGEDNRDSGNQGGQQPQGGQQGSGQPQGGQPAGGQPPQGGQPQGGQPQGQPGQGGQAPQGGQVPQGGQPAGGQPGQGGQTYGQGYQQPGLADKLQQPAVKGRIIETVGLFGATGVGLLLVAFVPKLVSTLAGVVFTAGAALVALGIGPVLAAVTGREFAGLNVERNTALAASYVATAAGYLVLTVLTFIGVQIAGGGSGGTPTGTQGIGSTGGSGLSGLTVGLGDVFVPLVFAALMVGVAGVVATYVERNY